MPFEITREKVNKDKLWTVRNRIDGGKVEIVDRFSRTTTISAGPEFKVGDSVLVVNGVLVGVTGIPTITEFEV